jgi:hypothetical protein
LLKPEVLSEILKQPITEHIRAAFTRLEDFNLEENLRLLIKDL